MSAPADDFVMLWNTSTAPVHLPLPRGEEQGASGVFKDMLLPGPNRVRRAFLERVAENPGLKIYWKARILTFDPPAEIVAKYEESKALHNAITKRAAPGVVEDEEAVRDAVRSVYGARAQVVALSTQGEPDDDAEG